MQQIYENAVKIIDNYTEKGYNKRVSKATELAAHIEKMQVSPSGMAAASQAVPGEFDSRHLLQVSILRTIYKSRVNGSDYLFISKKTEIDYSCFYFKNS